MTICDELAISYSDTCKVFENKLNDDSEKLTDNVNPVVIIKNKKKRV